MSRRRYRSHCDSIDSVVADSAYLAAKLGPRGAMVVGVAGFLIFSVAVPLWMTGWGHAQTEQLTGPTGIAFAHALDLIVQRRFVTPCRWVGVATLLACWAVALWKLLDQPELNDDDVERVSCIAKVIARLLGRT